MPVIRYIRESSWIAPFFFIGFLGIFATSLPYITQQIRREKESYLIKIDGTKIYHQDYEKLHRDLFSFNKMIQGNVNSSLDQNVEKKIYIPNMKILNGDIEFNTHVAVEQHLIINHICKQWAKDILLGDMEEALIRVISQDPTFYPDKVRKIYSYPQKKDKMELVFDSSSYHQVLERASSGDLHSKKFVDSFEMLAKQELETKIFNFFRFKTLSFVPEVDKKMLKDKSRRYSYNLYVIEVSLSIQEMEQLLTKNQQKYQSFKKKFLSKNSKQKGFLVTYFFSSLDKNFPKLVDDVKDKLKKLRKRFSNSKDQAKFAYQHTQKKGNATVVYDNMELPTTLIYLKEGQVSQPIFQGEGEYAIYLCVEKNDNSSSFIRIVKFIKDLQIKKRQRLGSLKKFQDNIKSEKDFTKWIEGKDKGEKSRVSKIFRPHQVFTQTNCNPIYEEMVKKSYHYEDKSNIFVMEKKDGVYMGIVVRDIAFNKIDQKVIEEEIKKAFVNEFIVKNYATVLENIIKERKGVKKKIISFLKNKKWKKKQISLSFIDDYVDDIDGTSVCLASVTSKYNFVYAGGNFILCGLYTDKKKIKKETVFSKMKETFYKKKDKILRKDEFVLHYKHLSNLKDVVEKNFIVKPDSCYSGLCSEDRRNRHYDSPASYKRKKKRRLLIPITK